MNLVPVSLLQCNDSPSQPQREQFSRGIADAIKQRDELNTLILELSAKRDAASDDISVYQKVLSPVRTIPSDIWAEIFVRCLPTSHNSVMALGEAPLILTRICKSWREIAMSTPLLWRSIHIAISPSRTPASQPHTAVKEWLDRSGTLPLHLSVYISPIWAVDPITDSPPDGWGSPPISSTLEDISGKALMCLLLQYAHKWQRVELQIESLSALREISECQSDGFPRLESLVCNPRRSEQDLYNFYGVFHSSSLRRLSFHRSAIMKWAALPVQWQNITHLRISLNLWSFEALNLTVLDLFRGCTSVEACTLRINSPRSDWVTPLNLTNAVVEQIETSSVVYLTKLHTLNLIDASQDYPAILRAVLSQLQLPSLAHLAYIVNTSLAPDEDNPVSPLTCIQSGTNSLESLRYVGPFSSEITEYLRMHPSIRRLHISPVSKRSHSFQVLQKTEKN